MGEHLLRCSNKIESSDLRQCPYDQLTNKAYLSGTTVRSIYESFTHKMAAKASWHRYGTKLHHCHPMCGTGGPVKEQGPDLQNILRFIIRLS